VGAEGRSTIRQQIKEVNKTMARKMLKPHLQVVIRNPKVGDPVQVVRGGVVVASSRNLAVIPRYAREGSYYRSMVRRGDMLHVRYMDGATCKARFADPSIIQRWIATRKERGLI